MKAIDAKYAIENGWIVKVKDGAPLPEDEPLVLFRAQDRQALPMLYLYRQLCASACCSQEHIAGIGTLIWAFERFKECHPARMKQPGRPRSSRWREDQDAVAAVEYLLSIGFTPDDLAVADIEESGEEGAHS